MRARVNHEAQMHPVLVLSSDAADKSTPLRRRCQLCKVWIVDTPCFQQFPSFANSNVPPAAEFGFSTVFLRVASIDVRWREIAPDEAGFDRRKIIVEQWLQAQAPEPAIRKLQAVDVLELREHGVRTNKWQKSVEYAAAFGFGHEA